MAIKKISQLNELPLTAWWLKANNGNHPTRYSEVMLDTLNDKYIDSSLIELSHFNGETNEPSSNSYWLSYQTTLGDFKAMIGLSAIIEKLNSLSNIYSEGISTIISNTLYIGVPNATWACGTHTVPDDTRPNDKLSVLVPYTFNSRLGGTFHGPTLFHQKMTATGPVHFKGSLTCDNLIYGTALKACWADLAEIYESDKDYPPGTLVKFGGENEITIATHHANAVVTSNPGFLMNKDKENVGLGIALTGRVPVRVIGKVEKFDKIVLSATPGVGIACNSPEKTPDLLLKNTVIGRALESSDDVGIKLVECTVQLNLD